MGLGLAYCHLMYHHRSMVALLIELVGGPDDGLVVEALWCGSGVVVHRGHRYRWCAEDTGAPYLRYEGESVAA